MVSERAEQSVGELFIGAVIPGLLLSGLYILYVIVSCMIDPSKGPPIPEEERIPFKEKVRLLSNMSAPIALIVIVLGVIFGVLSFWLKGLGHGRAVDQIDAKAEAAGPDQDARDLV